MRGKLLFCLLMHLTYGVFGAEAEDVRKERGESVTLHTGVKEYQKIIWMFGPQKYTIAQCRANSDETPSCDITERFKSRLQIDNQTGSLTINNISNELAGSFSIQIIDNLKKQKFKVFSLIISDPLPTPNIACDSERSSKCVLLCLVENVTDVTLSWYKGNSLVSSINVSDVNSISLEVDLLDITTYNYNCVVNNSISNQTKHLNSTELCQRSSATGLNIELIGLICLVLVPVLVLVLVLVIACYCKKQLAGEDGKCWKGFPWKTRTDESSPSVVYIAETEQLNSDPAL